MYVMIANFISYSQKSSHALYFTRKTILRNTIGVLNFQQVLNLFHNDSGIFVLGLLFVKMSHI